MDLWNNNAVRRIAYNMYIISCQKIKPSNAGEFSTEKNRQLKRKRFFGSIILLLSIDT